MFNWRDGDFYEPWRPEYSQTLSFSRADGSQTLEEDRVKKKKKIQTMSTGNILKLSNYLQYLMWCY